MSRQRTVVIIVLVVLLLCACFTAAVVGGTVLYTRIRADSTPTALRATPRATTAVVVPTVGPGTPQPTSEARTQGGVLRLPGSMPPTFDPALSGDSTSATYIVEVFSGLVTAGPDLQLIPDVAESYEVSADGRTYTFHLRTNVEFHDGRKLTADDFRYSLERSCNPSTGSPAAATYLGDIVGASEMLSGQADHLTGVNVVDDQTLEITIDAPRPSFLAKLSHPVAFAVDRNSIDSSDPVAASNGTGPFRLTQVAAGNQIVLEANPNYYRDPKPALDRVVFNLGGGSPVTMYETDELDASPVGSADLPRITDPANASSQELTVSQQLSTFYIGLNCQEPPFDDVKVRQAFAQAIDRQRIVDMLYDQTVPAANSMVPPQMPGYDTSGISAPTYDPQAARDLLAQSTYGGPEKLPEITLFVSAVGPQTDSVSDAIAYLIEDSLGVTINIQQADWPTFLDAIGQPDHQFQMFMLGWIADYPDPENFLSVLFSSNSADNHTRYSNPAVDQLLQTAGLEMDQTKRYDLYRQAETTILADAAVIPLYHDVEYWLTKPYVHDAYYPAMIVPRLQYIYMDSH